MDVSLLLTFRQMIALVSLSLFSYPNSVQIDHIVFNFSKLIPRHIIESWVEPYIGIDILRYIVHIIPCIALIVA